MSVDAAMAVARKTPRDVRSWAYMLDFGFAIALGLVWIGTHPSDEYDDPTRMVVTAIVSAFGVGAIWYALGGRAIIVGCAVQFLRFAASIALVVLMLKAFNPHMNNPCGDSYRCIENAQHTFFWIYASTIVTAVVSGVLLCLEEFRRSG